MLNTIANWASILGLLLVLGTIGYARRMTIHHLRSHMVIARQWVAGPAGAGWSSADITPSVELKWRHPRNQQVPLYSASALSEVTLLQNVFLPESLTPHLANVAQSIEAFNDSIAQYNAFKLSDAVHYVNVDKKLEAARKERFPEGPPPEDMTKDDLDAILTAAKLSPDEEAWSATLCHMLAHAHVTFIGNATGRVGLFRRLQELEREVATHV